MALEILTTATPLEAAQTQYRLPEASRQEILSQSDLFKKNALIERQRRRFIELNGTQFGEEQESSAVSAGNKRM